MNQHPPSQPLNPWNHKPWWCQPWSILSTGIGLIASSYFIFHRIWLSGLVALPVLSWMGFFLLVWPGMMRELLAETLETNPKPQSPET
ncbi:MAG: hypothetical protein HC825_10720 [Oscillatoriales cyanobacterium RM1_1_9]|nr:hypothetical protein [Oscillatoriales cyanobacterium SM2_3_0]NJO47947.1 hypothetical protein [Oscillatoriales cyanobacterium RM2_1_1]NJO72015.1 hypothetical protein [Oscillatoriales cyanobacterium RM1_1_9]